MEIKKDRLEMNQQFDRKFQCSWQEITSKYSFDSKFGFIIPPNYFPKTFDYKIYQPIAQNLAKLYKQEKIIQQVEKLPLIDYQKVQGDWDLLILRDTLVHISLSYLASLKRLGIDQKKFYLPQCLSYPIWYASNKLKVKYGMNSSISYNYKLLNLEKEPIQLTFDQVKMKWGCSQNQPQQGLFISAAWLGSLIMTQILKQIYEINQIIETDPQCTLKVKQKFKNIQKFWEKINQHMEYLAKHLERACFLTQIAPFFESFKTVYLKGPNVHAETPTGNAGNQPTFRMFQSAFGIDFKQKIQGLKGRMTLAYPYYAVNFNQFLKTNSLLRQYCSMNKQLKQCYNNIIKYYSKYQKLHSVLVKEVVVTFLQKELKNIPPEHNPFNDILNKRDYIKESELV